MPFFIPFLLVGAGVAAIGAAVAASSSSSSSSTTSNDAELRRAEKERRQRAAREDISAEAGKQLASLFESHRNVVSRRGVPEFGAIFGTLNFGSVIKNQMSDSIGSIPIELTFINIQRVSGFGGSVSREQCMGQLSALCPSATHSQQWMENESRISTLASEVDTLEKLAATVMKGEAVR